MIQPVSSHPGTLRPLITLASPVLLQQFLAALVGLVDTWLTGNFLSAEEHLAAIGLMAYVMWLLPSMFAAIAIGATALTARFVGGGRWRMAARAVNQSVLLGIGLALMAIVLCATCDRWFVSAMQLRGGAFTLAVRYLQFLIPVIPAIMLEQVGIACLRGAGDTFTGFVVMTIVNLVNAAVSTALVIGMGPVEKWGWDGLAMGTALAHSVGGFLILAALIAGRARMKLRWHWLRPNRHLLARLLRIGIPGGADQATILTCHLLFVRIVNSLGTDAAAAHSLGVRIEALAYLPGSAFQVAAATLTGQYLGAGQPRRAVYGAWMACGAAGVVMVSAGLLLFFGADALAAFFTQSGQDSPTRQLTAPLLRIVAFSMPSLALTMVLAGALRGAGDTRMPFLINLIGFVGVRLPLAVYLSREAIELPLTVWQIEGAGLGVVGAWYAMIADVVLRSILVVWRILRGQWKNIRV